jgi:2-keto-4-pentenoate hydratase/2-oxohepta-3-ene-1,7-dioic acid hydratase in catechol pathway
VRLFSYRVDPAAGGSYLAFGGGSLAFGSGVRVGRLFDDDTVEIGDGGRVPRTELRPAPAIPSPGKIVCVGLNYRDHVAEQHIDTPSRPVLFAKFANAVIGDGEPIVSPEGTHALDLEVELGVVIGRRARRVSRADALGHVAGYVVVNDVTARDWQGNKAALAAGEKGDGQWLRAKGSDTFLPMGPVLAMADELTDPSRLRLRSWRIPSSGPETGDEVLMQDGTTSDMIFDVPSLVEYISAVITLDPGDVVITGTPAGVGVFRHPPVFLGPGDRVRCEVEGIGRVENPVIGWRDVLSVSSKDDGAG